MVKSAITSTPWKKYWQNKKQKKEDEEKAKEERKAIREAKKREKEMKQKEKEAEKAVPKKKPKSKPRRQLFIESSSSDENSDTIDSPDSPSTVPEAVETLALSDLKKNVYVIFVYEGEYFPGVILETTQTGAKVSAMTMAGPDGWRWPEKEDTFHYDLTDIKEVIEPPTIRNSRGVSCVPEMRKYRV
nr:PREDICTED: actin-binding protein F-like isoform X1 [Bemisia tabaci]